MHLNGRFSSERELREKLDFIYEKSQSGSSFHGILEVASNEVTIITAIHAIKSNRGANTAGVDRRKMDRYLQMDRNKLISLVQSAFQNYQPKPARRVYIQKSNGKQRPLGIPTVLDRIVQECLRIVLEPLVEAKFFPNSYGFRPYRSVHDAVHMVFHYANLRANRKSWFVIEGDIKGFFDHINHRILLKKLWHIGVHDKRVLAMIKAMLKAGYMEDWRYHITYSGTPQGGIISPILANIYLHELDKFVMALKAGFDVYEEKKYTPEYNALLSKKKVVQRQIKKAEGEERQRLIEKYREIRKQILTTPAKSHTDKKIKYIRYADDFLIAVNGRREDCVEIKRKLAEFIGGMLKMELSEEKTLITHSSEYARFLGYDVRIRRDGKIRRVGKLKQSKRTLNNKAELVVPLDDKIHKFIFSKGIAIQEENGNLRPVHRAELLHMTDLEIVSSYNSELRGICNYYNLASNFYRLSYLAYLMEYSCLRTLANKHRSSVPKIIRKFQDGQGQWGIPYETKKGWKWCYFANYADCKTVKNPTDIVTSATQQHRLSVNTIEKRLKACECELCGTTDSPCFEIHHVNKLKNLKGKLPWEVAMIAKRRKTLVVCHNCHVMIHHQ